MPEDVSIQFKDLATVIALVEPNGIWRPDELLTGNSAKEGISQQVIYNSPTFGLYAHTRYPVGGSDFSVFDIRFESPHFDARFDTFSRAIAQEVARRIGGDRRVSLKITDYGSYAYHPEKVDLENLGRLTSVVLTVQQAGMRLHEVIEKEARRVVDQYVPE